MTPEEKFNQDVWWTLQVIKKEQLSTPTGENVKINTFRSSNRDANSPPTDDISKCIRKLEELMAFRVVEKYDADSYDPYYGANPDWERANAFELAINQPKFNEIYKIYEKKYRAIEKDEARVKEIRRQFEELDERQKAFEELGRQFSSRVQKNFDVKQYEEFLKRIAEQAEPIKKTLEQLNTAYSGSIQNSLTPVLQRLTESIKPIGEQMKRLNLFFEHPVFERPEYPKEAFISSDVIRAKQGAETISKLENIEALLQGLLTKNTKKETTVIKKLEIIGRDKIEQRGDKNTAEIKNITGNHPSKKWFSPNNLLVWVIGSIIIAVAAGLILNWLLR